MRSLVSMGNWRRITKRREIIRLSWGRTLTGRISRITAPIHHWIHNIPHLTLNNKKRVVSPLSYPRTKTDHHKTKSNYKNTKANTISLHSSHVQRNLSRVCKSVSKERIHCCQPTRRNWTKWRRRICFWRRKICSWGSVFMTRERVGNMGKCRIMEVVQWGTREPSDVICEES